MVKPHRISDALRCTHFGTWRALAALPAITGSVLLLIVLLGGLGRWEGPVLLAWMVAGLLALTRTWERVVLRFVCRVRAPTVYEAAALESIRLAVLNRCGLEPDRIDLRIADLPGRNAYAIGARSVILTRQLSNDYLAGKVGRDMLAAVLCHEVGHHVTGALRLTRLSNGSRFHGVWFAASARRSPRDSSPANLGRCWPWSSSSRLVWRSATRFSFMNGAVRQCSVDLFRR